MLKYLSMHLVLLFGSAVFLFLLRAPLHTELILDFDESYYFYMALRTFEEGLPYITAFDHKGPLLYWILAPIAHYSVPDVFPLRFFASLVLVLTMPFVYGCAYELSKKKFLSLLAPILYGLHFCHFKGLAVSAEIFAAAPIVMATWIFLKTREAEPTGRGAAVQGVLASSVFFIKMNVVISLIFIPIFYLFHAKSNKYYLKVFLFYSLGFFGFAGIIFLLFLLAGALPQFWHDYFIYNLGYIRPDISFSKVGVESYTMALKTSWPLLIGSLSLVGLLFTLRRFEKKTALLVLSLCGCALFASLAPGHAGQQHLLQLASPFSILVVYFLSGIPAKWGRSLAVVVFLIFVVRYRGSGPLALSLWKTRPTEGLKDTLDFISSQTAPSDFIFVSAEPNLYYLSNRRAPFRHFSAAFYKPAETDRRHIEPNMAFLQKTPPKLIVTRSRYFLPDAILENYGPSRRMGVYQAYLRKN